MSADVAVVGLGPAGRALAWRLLAHGASLVALDPHPDRSWQPTYGGWAHQLPDWLPDDVVGASATTTDLVARGRHTLAGTYAVLDNDALQATLALDGADVQQRAVADDELPGLARVVVDCRGNTRALAEGRTPVQEAYGLALPASVGARLLGGADAVLMDWRPFDGSASWGRRAASFCYLVPLSDGRLLAEETCLAGRPPVPQRELARRLRTRLRSHGIGDAELAGAEVERVHIAMLPPTPVLATPVVAPGPARLLRFGAAGEQVNPITGYSVFASLAAADDLAATLAAGRLPAPPDSTAGWMRRTALEALLQLDGDGTLELFDAFGRLPGHLQRAVLEPDTPAPGVLAALGRQATLLPPRRQAGLVAATAKGLLQ